MSQQQLASDMKELKGLTTEIKRLNTQIKGLREREKTIKTNLLNYLKQSEQSGVKYESLVAIREEKSAREKKKLVEKKNDVLRVLETNGIVNAESLYSEIMETMKGKKEKVETLKIKEQSI